MSRATLDAVGLAETMRAFAAALERHVEVVNRLNVYPVPDGDTGTNMALTLSSVLAELDALPLGGDGRGRGDDAQPSAWPQGAPGGTVGGAGRDGTDEMGLVCQAIAHGSLMGARGNSGVILCQLLRGATTAIAGMAEVGPVELARALEAADQAARAGVMRPVEGTMLTVASAAASGAASAAKGGASLLEVLEAAREAARDALWRTPELLPVLADAGVVDAGGAGLLLLFDALLEVVDGRPPAAELPLPEAVRALISSGPVPRGGARGHGPRPGGGVPVAGPVQDVTPGAPLRDDSVPGGLRYEVMYFLEAPDEAVPAFRELWAGIGDSIVVVGGDGLWNCHIHTNDVGAAIEAALDVGRPRQIRVTDLADQVDEEAWVRGAGGPGEEAEPPAGPPAVTGVVAVATGDGVRRIFRSLGVRHVVAGGQSMNPSTAQILEAVEAVPSEEVVVLPNNRNILPVAEQAAALARKKVRVVPTAGIQEGFAALLEYDPQAGAEENAEGMRAAAERVVAGEVTRAVRPSESSAGRIRTGDYIGLSRSGIVSVAPTLAEATCKLLDALVGEGHEIVTLIEGEGAGPADTRRVVEWLHEHRPGVEVERHEGGQPLYPYLVSVE